MKVTSGRRAVASGALSAVRPHFSTKQVGLLIDLAARLVDEDDPDAARDLLALAVADVDAERIIGLLATEVPQ